MMYLARFCVLFVLCFAVSFADSLTIRNANEFVTLVNKAANGDFNYDINLFTDLDFQDDELRGIVDKLPLGMVNSSYCTPYTGTFDGKGNTLKNLKMTDKEYSGLICDSRNAVIKNLVIDGNCAFSGNYVGGISVNASGSITLENITVHGTMSGKNVSGGMIGAVNNLNSGSIIVEDCGFHGTSVCELGESNSTSFVGGLIGLVYSCVNSNLRISKIEIDGVVSTTFTPSEYSSSCSAGGFVGSLIGNDNIDIAVSGNLNNVRMNHQMVDYVNNLYVGGGFGFLGGKRVSIRMENNVHEAKMSVATNGTLYASGFVGYMSTKNGTLFMTRNTNDGDLLFELVNSKICYGGFIGYMIDQLSIKAEFESNTNNARIQVKTLGTSSSNYVGGFGGYLSFSLTSFIHFYGNQNNGDVVMNEDSEASWDFVASEFVAFLSSSNEGGFCDLVFSNNTNNGNFVSRGSAHINFGVFVGISSIYTSGEVSFLSNVNNGNITAERSNSNTCFFGGLIGYFSASFVSDAEYDMIHFINNNNKGVTQFFGSSVYYGGGLVGYFYCYGRSQSFFKNNNNNGMISIDSLGEANARHVGGIIGYLNCYQSWSDTSVSLLHFINNKNSGEIRVIGTTEQRIAGLVAYIYLTTAGAVVFSDNANTGDVRVSTSGDYQSSRYVGGCLGYCDISGVQHNISSFVNNINNGSIYVYMDTASYQYVGGFAGYLHDNNNADAVFGDIFNWGDINVDIAALSYACTVGGIVGDFYSWTRTETHLSNFINHGSINTIGSSFFYAGGVFGYGQASSSGRILFNEVVNNGFFHCAINHTSCHTSYLGGISGQLYLSCSAELLFSDNANNGNLLVESRNVSSKQWFEIGGLAGYFSSSGAKGCRFSGNTNNGIIKATGGVTYFGGGFIGYGGTTFEYGTHEFFNNSNNADLFFDRSGSSEESYVGGFGGHWSWSGKESHFRNNENKGKINIWNSSTSDLNRCFYVGGLMGHFSCSNSKDGFFHDNNNHGYINASGSSCFYAGGLFGYGRLSAKSEVHLNDNTNNADVFVDSSSDCEKSSFVGGVVGYLYFSDENGTQLCNIINNGNVKSISNYEVYVGGISGLMQKDNSKSFPIYGITNNGNVNVELLNNSDFNYIGGFVGYCSWSGLDEADIFGVNNNGRIDVQADRSSFLYISGLLGFLSYPGRINLELRDNINNGLVDVSGAIATQYYGGIIGFLYSYASGIDEGISTVFENKNNGNATFNLKACTSCNLSHYISIGGLIGSVSHQSNSSTVLDSNTNNGLIEGTFATGGLSIGGIAGAAREAGDANVVGNTNRGRIKVSCLDVSDDYYSFVGGIMGVYPNSSWVSMTDNANYGDVVGECVRKQAGTCGLVCSPGTDSSTRIKIENCANHGDIEGMMAYGISDITTTANNVVNLGKVSGTTEQYSLWKNVTDGATSVYGVNGGCKNCADYVMLIEMSESDGRYRLVDDNSILVDEILNIEARKKTEYKKIWDRKLCLRDPITIHIESPVSRTLEVPSGLSMEECGVPEEVFKYHLIPKGYTLKADNEYNKNTVIESDVVLVPYHLITISGIVTETIYIEASGKHNLGDISDKLKEYFKSKDYAIGDLDTNELFNGDPIVTTSMNVSVIPRNTVIIEMEGETVLAVDVDANQIAKEISALTGISTDNILVDMVVDDKGYILRIIVILKDAEMSDDVVVAINNLVKGDKCNVGVLCRSVDARIVVPGQSISHAEHNRAIQVVVLLLSAVINLSTMMMML